MSEYSSHDSLKNAALDAAWSAGHASAMMANLCLAGNPERTDVWQAEQEAWLRRQNEFIAALPLGRQALSDQVANLARASFETFAVTRLK